MKTRSFVRFFRFLNLALLAPFFSATTDAQLVDWLTLLPGGSAADFALADDGGVVRARGSLDIATGLAFPGLPVDQLLAGAFFASPTGLTNTAGMNADIDALRFRVVPAGGAAAYEIRFTVPPGHTLYLSISELLRDAAGATEAIVLGAGSDNGPVPIGFRGTRVWDDGIKAFDQPLAWDPALNKLSTLPDADGESQIALFEIGPTAGANPFISLTVASGYSVGTGDQLIVALGMDPIPEPAHAAFAAALAGLLLVILRHRRAARKDE